MSALLKKISIKTVVGNIRPIIKGMDHGASVAVLRVVGVANGVKRGTSDYGDWEALVGMFKATNLITGENHRSSKCFLPDVATDMIASVVSNGSPVEFAIDIHAVVDDESQLGYTYAVHPLLEPGEDDAIARLEKHLALPAPTAEAKSGETEQSVKKAAKK